jgi:hypothetical protein
VTRFIMSTPYTLGAPVDERLGTGINHHQSGFTVTDDTIFNHPTDAIIQTNSDAGNATPDVQGYHYEPSSGANIDREARTVVNTPNERSQVDLSRTRSREQKEQAEREDSESTVSVSERQDSSSDNKHKGQDTKGDDGEDDSEVARYRKQLKVSLRTVHGGH